MIYTFYSYKGGVGRSMALANIAEMLYRNGLKVLMVDFDLEAPGLERYFDVKDAIIQPDSVITKRGIIDMLFSYLEISKLPKINSQEQDDVKTSPPPSNISFSVEPLKQFVTTIYEKGDNGGELNLITAGLRAGTHFSDYANKIRSFDWDDFFINWNGERFFEWFRLELKSHADVILIDSRTGVTEMSGVCTFQLSDAVILFVTANKQNIDGTLQMAESLANPEMISEARKDRPLPILFVPSRVDDSEANLLGKFSEEFQKVFVPFISPDIEFKKNAFIDLMTPYVPYYAYTENVAAREPNFPSAATLIEAYERLNYILAHLAPVESDYYGKFHDKKIGQWQRKVKEAYAFAKRRDETIPKNQLETILVAHKLWLDSGGKEGLRADLLQANLQKAHLAKTELMHAHLEQVNLQNADLAQSNLKFALLKQANLESANLAQANLEKANLSGAFLQTADFREANLKEVLLTGANLQETNFSEANLEKADLRGADFKGAQLRNTNIQKANLANVKGLGDADIKYANFEDTTGLLGTEFAQNDITGTKLPSEISSFKSLVVVEETSKNARKIYFAMILCSIYTWLTILTTSDIGLVSNLANSPLPIIGTMIPIASFYFIAPLVLIAIFIYFHFYIDTLWEALADLPAIFPDGKRLNQKAYPWLLNILVCRHFKLLRSRPLLSHFKELVIIFFAWWIIPLTFIAFWLRYLIRRDWIGTSLHLGLIIISTAVSAIFYRSVALKLQGRPFPPFLGRGFWRDSRFYRSLTILLIGLLFSVLSYGSINAIKSIQPNYTDIRVLVPWIFEKIGFNTFANFRERDVSTKPDNYSSIDNTDRLKFVTGANLRNRNLRYADMFQSFLVKADLRNADLQGADLRGANLTEANLRGANLKNALLVGTNLQMADLRGANFQGSILLGANIQSAQLREANLREADLREANLQTSDLTLTNLDFAVLTRSKLQGANLSSASLRGASLWQASLNNANLIEANLQKADLTEANFASALLGRADLKRVNLVKANLKNADLRQADFTESNLDLAHFDGAYLSGAILKDVENLKVKQLINVKTLYNSVLDPAILEKIKRSSPNLLETPEISD